MRLRPHDRSNHAFGALFPRSHRHHRAGGGTIRAAPTALGLLATANSQVVGPTAHGDPCALALGTDRRRTIAPGPPRRDGKDSGEPQVECPGGTALVWQRARHAAAGRTSIVPVD